MFVWALFQCSFQFLIFASKIIYPYTDSELQREIEWKYIYLLIKYAYYSTVLHPIYVLRKF
jgi:hypothetical protein